MDLIRHLTDILHRFEVSLAFRVHFGLHVRILGSFLRVCADIFLIFRIIDAREEFYRLHVPSRLEPFHLLLLQTVIHLLDFLRRLLLVFHRFRIKRTDLHRFLARLLLMNLRLLHLIRTIKHFMLEKHEHQQLEQDHRDNRIRISGGSAFYFTDDLQENEEHQRLNLDHKQDKLQLGRIIFLREEIPADVGEILLQRGRYRFIREHQFDHIH